MRRRITSDELHELFAGLGKAIWYLQHVEDALHTFMTVKVDVKTRGAVSPEQAEELFLKNRRATLGTAVRIARENDLLPPELHERLVAFKEERDWLVHRSLHQHGDDLHVPDELSRLMHRIETFVHEARWLQKAVSFELESFVCGHGVSRSWIDKEALRLLREARGEEA